jgi:UDP-N-acetylmuramyl pentapeptide phosphotransferase/UDP-N-acetylglucosamine-1-phosphate transferase
MVLAVAIVLIKNAGRFSRIDLPDARRLHQAPTPRGGGLAMPVAISGAAVAWVLAFAPERRDVLFLILGFALPNGVLGIVDDYKPLRSRVKFGIQALLAIGFVALVGRIEHLGLTGLGSIDLGLLAYPFTVLFLVWSTNVYNFMDGMDGLAGGSGAAFFATLAGLAWLGGDPGGPLAWTAVFGASACIGFLLVNYPPARIFMGDGGALYVGALLGALAVAVAGPAGSTVPFAAAVLAMGSFMWDATYTIVMRIVRREDWLHPHKRHLFQRLVTAGWSHTRVRWLYGMLAVLGSVTAFCVGMGSLTAGNIALLAAILAFGATSVVTERAEKQAPRP